MKNSVLKKLIYFVIAFVILLTVGCGETTVIDLAKELEEVAQTVPAKAENDLIFPTSEGAITIQWSSNKPEVLSNDGKVNRGDVDVVVELTITMIYSGKSEKTTVSVIVPKKDSVVNPTEKEFTVIFKDKEGNVLSTQKIKEGKAATAPTVPSVEGYEFKGWDKDFSKVTADLEVKAVYEKKEDVVVTSKTIAEVIATENGEYTVTAVVVAVNAQSFLIKDETGMMLVYKGATWSKDVEIGDKVKVNGETTIYGGAKQFGAAATYEKVSTEKVVYSEPKELSATDADAYLSLATITPEYVKVTGKLSVSSGKYFNIAIEGATIIGSATYPLDVEAVTALDGKEVEVVGYVTGVSGSSTKYLNILFTEIKEVQETEPEIPVYEEKTISEIIAAENGKYIATGVVVGVNAQSYLIKDGTGMMLVYKGATWSKDVEVGDKVKVTGDTTVYGGAKQFGATCTYEKVGTDKVIYEEAKELTAAEADEYLALANITPEYVKVTGKLSVSNGKYFNIAIEGATIIGSVTYPLDVEAVSALDGKDVEVVGYVTGVSGSSTKYLNILFTEIKEISNGEVIPSDKEYTVVFFDADGNELLSLKVKEGQSAKAPNAPEIEGYEFKGWDTDFLKVTSDLVIKPIYEEKQEVIVEEKTIAEVIASENGEYTTTGVVVGVNAQSFLIKDETGAMLVYCGYNFAKDVEVGYKVKVTGTTSVYGKAKQFGQGSTYEKVDTSVVDYGTAKELTAADCDAYAVLDTITPEYVKFTGKLTVSNGKYFNIAIEGATIIGSATYPLDVEAVSALDGKDVEVVGYVTGVSGSSTKYLNILFTEIKEISNGEVIPSDKEYTVVFFDADGNELLSLKVKEGQSAKAPNAPEIEGYEFKGWDTDFLKVTSDLVIKPIYEEKQEVIVEEKTIAEVIASENGEYTTTGVVVGVNAQSFLIKDETGAMLVYNGSAWTKDVEVGDKVKVTGTTSVYGKAKQFGAGSTYEKVGTSEVKQDGAKELSGEDCDVYINLETIVPELVKVTGDLAVSGNYYNLTIEGATIIGSLSYPLNKEEVNAFNGKTIEVTGYITGTSGSDKYLNILVLDITEVEGEDPENPGGGDDPVVEEKTIAEIIASENGSYITTGVVVGVNAQSFLIKDETGMMLVYCGSSFAKDLQVGDKVKVTGTTSVYGKAKQFGAGSTYEKVANVTVDHGTAKELSAADCDAYGSLEAITPEYVKVSGKLAVSNGKYFNLTIEGATIVGSVTYPIDSDAVTALDGHNIEIYGYVTGTSSSDKYLNLLVLDINEVEGGEVTPEPEPDPEPEQPEVPVAGQEVKFDFVTNFSTYAKTWESAYSSHTVTNTDLGVNTKATFVLSNADKQAAGNTIDDRPVLATKSTAEQYITVTGFEGKLNQVTFELKQWTTKKFTKLVIQYTVDGTNWVNASADAANGTAMVLPNNGVFTSNALPEGVTGVRFVFLGSTTSNNQIGLTSITLKFAE